MFKIKIKTRILTADQISKMPLHNLKLYQKSINNSKKLLRYSNSRAFLKREFDDLNPWEFNVELARVMMALNELSFQVRKAIRAKK